MRVVPIEDLTAAQQAFVFLPADRHAVAVGAPGSGKSLVLVHRAKHLIENLGLDPQRVRIVTYTNMLEHYIAAGLKEVGLPSDIAISYDDLMRQIHTAVTGKPFKSTAKGENDRFFALRDAVHDLLKSELSAGLFEVDGRFDAILVDETQDLAASDVGTLAMLANHVSAVLDGRQQLYKRGASTAEILRTLGLRWETRTLLDTYRCSRAVITIAASIARDDDKATLPHTRVIASEATTSMRYVGATMEDEFERFTGALRTRTREGRSCAVLLPARRYLFGVADALQKAGFAVEADTKVDLTTNAVKVMTYHSAKGLAFDSVFLPRLRNNAFRGIEKHHDRRSLLFVALTRATTYLYLGTIAGDEIPEWKELAAVPEPYLAAPVSTPTPSGPTPGGASEEDLDRVI
ncbi:UvrD-helicase domain-containing protein [Xylanimonas protaetiae]|uniref:DNA 3'-5' helicase n=1 Tax=Xylanimonas protaetiae TaxID=2509457 RepID=A0A4P6F9L2_9MICO|nr:UvrD-helicase domain-containing protein [Xylanimonas protaetiae]QAY71613.1 ATP-dependent helicase [Xylanimonas protaetiae]